MKKINYAIGTIMIPAILSAGCGAKEVHYIYMPNQKPDPQEYPVFRGDQVIKTKDLKNLHKNKIKSLLFSEIVTHQLSEEKRNEFLASSLLYLIKNENNKKFELRTDYLDQFESIDVDLLFIGAGKVLDQKIDQAADASERYKQFLEQLSQAGIKKTFNSYEVANLLLNVRRIRSQNSDAAAKEFLNSQLAQWSNSISGITFDLALDNNQVQKTVQDVIGDVRNGMLVVPKLSSGISEIAKALPSATETQKVIKDQFSKFDQLGTTRDQFVKVLNAAVVKDVQKARQDLQIIVEKNKGYKQAKNALDRVDAALDIGAFAIQAVFGPNKEIQKVVNVARSAIAVTKAVCSINFGKIGANLATGNIIGAVSDIVGSLFGGSAGMDPETKQMLQNIQQDIADFRNHVDERFDQVIAKLDEQLKLLQQVDAKLDKIQNTLNEMTLSISQISQKIDQGFDSIFENEFKSNYVNCFKSSLNVPGDLGHLRDCLDYFFHYASNSSLLPQQTGEFNVSGDLPLNEIKGRLINVGSLNKFGFLDVAINNVFDKKDANGNPKLNLKLYRVNISDFIIGTEGYLSLIKSNSDIISVSDTSTIDSNLVALRSMAKNIQDSLLRLSDQNYLSEKVDEYYLGADLLGGSTNFNRDLDVLEVKYKLLINMIKIADPLNIYKMPEYEDLFVLNEFSKVHVNLSDYLVDGTTEKIDQGKVNQVRARIRSESIIMKDYLQKRYVGANLKGRISTLIDPVLDHIEMVEKGLQPRF
jgi:hypothetical protein